MEFFEATVGVGGTTLPYLQECLSPNGKVSIRDNTRSEREREKIGVEG